MWTGKLVSNFPGFTQGEGSIFRVSVDGIVDTPIELRSGPELIVANSGSKPEYGPFAVEFAPVTAGTWTVTVPALNVSLNVVADNYNLAIIEFFQMPVSEATPEAIPTPTATALGGGSWEGKFISESPGSGVPFSRLLVRVVGRENQPVRLSTIAQEINTANTGQKPDELGPNTVEFTGLTPGSYIVEPLGLNVSLPVELKPNVETRLEFLPAPPLPSSTPQPIVTNTPQRPRPTPTSTPTVAPTPTETATLLPTPFPTQTATSLPTSTPVTRWVGAVNSRTDDSPDRGTIIVRIAGIEGLPVRLQTPRRSTFIERRCVTGQGELGQDRCAFQGLTADQYVVSPEGLDLSLPVTLFDQETVQVGFDLEILPAGISGWQAQLHGNTNGAEAVLRTGSTIRVRIVGREGQVVALRPARMPGASQFCEVAYNPVLGGLYCEFGQLGPGVYLVEAMTTGASLRVFADGAGRADLEFSPSATDVTLASSQSPPLVGQGARPRLPTATVTAAPTRMPLVLMPARPTATTTPSPTPAFAWQGRIVESAYIGSGSIGVRAAGLEDHPVILSSGDWHSRPQLTGSKQELGDFATEFGGLAQGEYVIELVDLAKLKVNLLSGEFMLVEFRYDFVNLP
jgi:hypothetical protein